MPLRVPGLISHGLSVWLLLPILRGHSLYCYDKPFDQSMAAFRTVDMSAFLRRREAMLQQHGLPHYLSHIVHLKIVQITLTISPTALKVTVWPLMT